MKAIKYFLYTLIATVVLAGCSDDPTYTRGESEADGCYGVYFPSQDNAADLELDPADPKVLTFTAMRTNDTDAITVPVTVTGSEDGIFSASEISFDDGATETTFQVSFPDAEIGTTYSCNIQIDDKRYAFIYGEKASGMSFSVTRVKWNLVTGEGGETKGKWREDILTTFWGIANLETDVEIYERDDMPGYYRIQNVYSAEFLAALFEDTPEEMAKYRSDATTVIDATDASKVWIPYHASGVDLGYGMISFGSEVSENFSNSDNLYGKLEEGIITFPSRGLLMSMPEYNSGGLYYSNTNGLLRIMMPGVKDYDYSLALSAGEPTDGKVEIAARLGANVAKVKYAFFEGVFGDAIAKANSAGIDAGTVESKEITATGTIVAELEETGKYTVVANIYNEADELQGYEFLSFGYVKAGDDKPVVLSVRTELTWEFEAQGHTPENSIRGILFGEDIESGYMGLFRFSELEGKSSEDLIEIAKTSGKTITAEEIDKINDTGLSLLYTGLDGGTDYALLVWADNGYYGKLMYSKITTEGTPNPLQRNYTIDDLYTVDKETLFKTWNLWAVDFYDETTTKRQHLGQFTFSENTEKDEAELDAINLKGLTLGDIDDDTVVWEYYNGIIYGLAATPLGSISAGGQTLYLSYAYLDPVSGQGTTGDYAMLGGITQDGYIAFVTNHKTYNLNAIWIRAFSDPQCTQGAGNWAIYHDLVLEDPAVAGTSGAPARITRSQLHDLSSAAFAEPQNFVELHGRERMHALIDEHIGRMPANRGKNFETVEMPALSVAKAKVDFRQGVAAPSKEITRKTGTKATR